MVVDPLGRRAHLGRRREDNAALAVLRHIDFLLVLAILALAAFGAVMVYSATRSFYPAEPAYYLKRQIVYAATGVAVMVFCALFDYRRLEEWGYVLYGAAVAALVAVKALGHTENGAQRWISFSGVQFQPSEFAVLAVIAVIAVYLSRHERVLNLPSIAALVALAGIPLLLVVVQPDLGTALLLTAVLFVMLYVGGVRLRFLAALVVLGVAAFAAAVALHLFSSYQLDRLTAFLHPSTGIGGLNYEVDLSKTAIGAGGVRGTGLYRGLETSLAYVPYQYADFIFSAVGEQLGFVGSAIVVGLYGVVVYRIFRAIQVARDSLGRLLCAGVLAFLVISVFENIGMATGIMPITGIPLPFISYGGSALVAFFVAAGLVVNVELHRSRAR
ncbi:MAG TPA: rod shape-determining protein RodA [Acidimicrobiales bacterium]|nr:rod shape-determining protein RodA [Acidimicrobiales bacterium]